MSLSPRHLVIGALLLCSLGTNGVLFARWRGRAAAAPTTAAALEPTVPGEPGSPWRRGPNGGAPVKLDGCGVRAAALEGRLAELGRLRALHTPPAQRWEDGPPNDALTATVEAELARHAPAGAAPIRAQCRERLCRVFVAPGEDAAVDRFLGSEWRERNLRAVERDESGLLLRQREPDRVEGGEVLQTALQDFEASGAVERCQAAHRGETTGTLDAQLSLTADQAPGQAAGIGVESGGPLVGTPLGKCIDQELRQAMAALTLPPKYDDAVVAAQFPRR
jgi:hypothetical protein